MRYVVRLAVLCAVLLPLGCGPAAPDIVLVHGTLFGRPAPDHAIAIRGGQIAAVGTDEAILKTAGRGTVIYDLGGRDVLPGFNDAHFHWMPTPDGIELQFSGMDPTPGPFTAC